MKIKQVINGRQFDSISEACKYFNVQYNTVNNRMRSTGETSEQAINYYIQHGVKQSSQPVTVNGRQFDSISEACRYFNAKYDNVIHRMRCNTEETLEQAINYYIQHGIRQHSQPVVINGKQFRSLAEACRCFNAKYVNVLNRMRCNTGETPEQAINYYIQHPQSIVVNGKQFVLIKDACNYFNVQYYKVLYRMKSECCTVEQAINYCIKNVDRHRSQPVVVRGKQYESVADMNNKLDICSSGSIDIVFEQMVSQGYIQQLDGSFLKIR